MPSVKPKVKQISMVGDQNHPQNRKTPVLIKSILVAVEFKKRKPAKGLMYPKHPLHSKGKSKMAFFAAKI